MTLPPPQEPASAPPIATGELTIECEPPARVTLDGRDVGMTPIDLRIVPGEHELALSANGRRIVKRLAIGADDRRKLMLKIE